MTARYAHKREAILETATEIVNAHGVKGLTIVRVAEAVKLSTTSITYYFKRKEELAAAVMERSLERRTEVVRRAGAEPTPKARVRGLVTRSFEYIQKSIQGEVAPLAILADIPVLQEPARTELTEKYVALSKAIRGYFETGAAAPPGLHRARGHFVLGCVSWGRHWSRNYIPTDLPRLTDRLCALLESGLATAPAETSLTLSVPETRNGNGDADYLAAATNLINERNYKGVSVKQIAERLNVTKGSFYYYHDGKDDLVAACFDRTHEEIFAAQDAAMALDANGWERLHACLAHLIDIQLFSDGPLLRPSALDALPDEMRARVVGQSNMALRRFAGMVSDGICDGSIHRVDALVAADAIEALIYSAWDLRPWASRLPAEQASRYYLSTLAEGLFDDTV